MKPWQLKQEINIKYVALTRTKQELYLVSSDSDRVLKTKSEIFDKQPARNSSPPVFVTHQNIDKEDIQSLIAMFDEEMMEYHNERINRGYDAKIIETTINRKGGYKTAKQFISSEPSNGFKELQKRNLLAYSIEALIAKPEYSPLFTAEEQSMCRKLLESHGYSFNE